MTKSDGRTARAERTRDAVVDALLALINEGELRPTAARIAERAGVSLRSVFQHFDDMEALLTKAGAVHIERISELARPLPCEGPLERRVRALVDQRGRIFEFTTPVRRSSMLHEPFSAALRAARTQMLALAQDEVETLFAPELAALEPGTRRDVAAAVDAAATWDTWEHLRARRGLSVVAAKRVITRTLLALLSA